MAADVKSYSEVNECGVQLVSLAGTMAENFGVIQEQFNKISSGDGIFDGQAASDIKSQINGFISQLTTFSDAVKSCGEFVQNTVAAYQAVDSAARSAVSGGGSN